MHCRYDDGFFYANFEHGNTIDSDDLIPATKEQRDYLFQKMKEAGYEWNDKKKELKKIEQKFHEGDWVVGANNVFKIISLNNELNSYIAVTQNNEEVKIPYYFDDAQGHMCSYHLWTIEDAKDGDVLSYKDEISIYKHDIKNCTKEDTNFGGFVYYCCYDGKRLVTDSLYSLTEKDKKDIHPATKEQREQLKKAMADAGYTFDFEKKELKKIEQKFNIGDEIKTANEEPLAITKIDEKGYWSEDLFICDFDDAAKWELVEQKPAWSEEDEMMVLGVEQVMQCASLLNIVPDKIEKVRDWLKSLKQRYTWKPSDEQIVVFEDFVRGIGESGYASPYENNTKLLYSLLNDLKKLKG